MNPIGEWARLLLGAFAGAGVRDVVLSPGSRSTPFAIAAASDPRLACHAIVDERSAAFHALGRARVADRPVVLLSTSGTAPAHFLPAVVEASRARVPLVVLSADRPLHLQDCGASQTVDQVKLYGDHARWYVELGPPDPDPVALRAVRRIAVQAVHRSLHPEPGPVHLNARAAKPLEPGPARTDLEREFERAAREVAREPLVRSRPPRALPDPASLDEVAALVGRASRGLIVCGPGPLSRAVLRERVFALAERTGFALAAEATSQFRFAGSARSRLATLDALDPVCRAIGAGADLAPDVLIQIGEAPISAGWEALLAAGLPIPRAILADHGWPDPWSSAGILVAGDLGESIGGLVARIRRPPRDGWAGRIAGIETAARGAILAELDRTGAALTEGKTARAAVEALPPGGLLVLGNSLPVRSIDLYAPGDLADVLVASQRGAAGIDGLVSGAAGAAAALGRPAVALLGDLSFLHDATGLATAARLGTPLAIVVVANGGGRIFEQLPIAREPGLAAHLELFTTPHGIDSFAPAAAQFGIPYERAGSVSGLGRALAGALARPGATLVEAAVRPHGAAEEDARVRAAVEAALREEAIR